MSDPFAVALGANLSSAAGPPAAGVSAALRHLAALFAPLSVSRLWASAAVPSGPDYVNAVAAGRTGLAPQAVLARLQAIERGFGRVRHARWAPRVIDLDLLFVGDRILPDPETQARWRALPPERQRVETPEELVLPHPRLEERAFVLAPLAEAAPAWRSPVSGRSAAEALARLPEEVRAATRPF